MLKTAFVSIIFSLISCLAVVCQAAEPVFHLTFQDGLLPQTGGDGELPWGAEKPPDFYDDGLIGPAFLIGENHNNVYAGVPAPDNTADNGTAIFWSRGLEGWDIWSFGADPCITTTLAQIGGGMIYKWCWYANLVFYSNYTRGPVLSFPMMQDWKGLREKYGLSTYGLYGTCFDQYSWTQIGISWQKTGEEEFRLRAYLNGRMVAENTSKFVFQGLSVGGNVNEGGRRLVDNIKIWDRVLTHSEVKRLYRHDMKLMNSPLISLTVAETPSIDGRIEAEEWSGASGITGLLDSETGEMAVDRSVFYLSRDDNYLYIAMQGDMTELARTEPALVFETFLRAEHSGRNPSVFNDDTVEIIISPEYWNAENHFETGDWKEYRILMNSANGYYSEAYGPGGRDESWDPKPQFASTVSSGGWQFEARIPIDSFNNPLPEEGEGWGLQVGRVWRHLKEGRDVWTWGLRYMADEETSVRRRVQRPEKPIPYQDDTVRTMYMHGGKDAAVSTPGVMLFSNVGAPIVKVIDTGRLQEQELDFNAEIYNPSISPREVEVRLYTDTDELDISDMLVLEPGKSAIFTASRHLQDYAASRLCFEVYEAGGELLHRTDIAFYMEQSFGVNIIQLPNYEKLLLELDLGIFSDIPLDAIFANILFSDENGATVFQRDGLEIDSYMTVLEERTDGFEPGNYSLLVTIRHGDDVVASENMPFMKTAKAEWYGNNHGNVDFERDRVPYPWTDMKVSENTVSVWGREYLFGDAFLPEQVTTLGRGILRSPMRMTIQTDDSILIDTMEVRAEGVFGLVKRTRAEGVRVIEKDGIRLSNNFWIEYDGLAYCNISISTEHPLTLDSIMIEVPFTEEFSDVSWGSWYGNGDGGMQIFTERYGRREAFASDIRKAGLEKTEGTATWRMDIGSVSLQPGVSYEITLGFIATPARPKTWRTPVHSGRSLQGGGAWYPKGLEFMPAADPGFDFYGYGLQSGRVYVHTTPVNTGSDQLSSDDFTKYGYEWLANLNARLTGDEKTVRTASASRSFRDYFVWRHWRYKEKYGFAGLYFDNPSGEGLHARDIVRRLYNITNDNQYYGAGEQAIGGAQNGVLDLRYMSFWNYHWDGEHLNSAINSSQPTYLGIIDTNVYRAQYHGHNIGWPVFFLGQGRIRREWVEANGGPEAVFDHISGLDLLHDGIGVCCIMPGIGGTGAQAQEMRRVRERMSSPVEKYNLRHWVYQFNPYWRQNIARISEEGIYASFYVARPSVLTATNPKEHQHRARVFGDYVEGFSQMPPYMQAMVRWNMEQERRYLETLKDRAVIIFYNDTGWEGEMRVDMDWKKLGLGVPEELRVENAVHSTGFHLVKKVSEDGSEYEEAEFFDRPQEHARIEDSRLVFPMTAHNYRMIVVEKR